MYGVSAPADASAAHLLVLGILAVPQTCMRLNLRLLKRHLKLRRHLKLAEVRAQLQIQLTSAEGAHETRHPGRRASRWCLRSKGKDRSYAKAFYKYVEYELVAKMSVSVKIDLLCLILHLPIWQDPRRDLEGPKFSFGHGHGHGIAYNLAVLSLPTFWSIMLYSNAGKVVQREQADFSEYIGDGKASAVCLSQCSLRWPVCIYGSIVAPSCADSPLDKISHAFLCQHEIHDACKSKHRDKYLTVDTRENSVPVLGTTLPFALVPRRMEMQLSEQPFSHTDTDIRIHQSRSSHSPLVHEPAALGIGKRALSVSFAVEPLTLVPALTTSTLSHGVQLHNHTPSHAYVVRTP
jgi:hypothetical protein